VWFRERVREADDAFGQGHTEEAVTLLYDLALPNRGAIGAFGLA
jgi:hypothetical protein